jgi:hypothetical protein
MSLGFQSDVSPVLGAVIGDGVSNDVGARVFRFLP